MHTSASLIITENTDPDVLADCETIISRLVQDSSNAYRHSDEGPDDMAAHFRSILTQTQLSIPIVQGQLHLGMWQGLFLWEHRIQPHQRQVASLCWEVMTSDSMDCVVPTLIAI